MKACVCLVSTLILNLATRYPSGSQELRPAHTATHAYCATHQASLVSPCLMKGIMMTLFWSGSNDIGAVLPLPQPSLRSWVSPE